MKISIRLLSILCFWSVLFACDLNSNLDKSQSHEIVRLKGSLDSLKKKVDSLNSKIIELEGYQQEEIFSESSCLNSDLRSESDKERKIICPSCNGTGEDEENCPHCEYNIYCDRQRSGGYENYGSRNCSICSRCQGKGTMSSYCDVCKGSGRVNEYE